jgi:hypothetical protein
MNLDELVTIMYWVIGLLILVFLAERIFLRPYQERSRLDRLVTRLHQTNPDFAKNFRYKDDYGIVIVVDNHTFVAGILAIWSMRGRGCRLPVIVCHSGDCLSNTQQEFLKKQQLRSLIVPGYEGQQKINALLQAPFKNVLLINAELLFLSDPTSLFQAPEFKSGALFWKDRQTRQPFWDQRVINWVQQLVPYKKGDNRILNKQSGSYQSNDLILLNKSTHHKTLENLWVMSKNWDIIGSTFGSDKELYWICAELAKENYAFNDFWPGIIGSINMDLLCGQTLHFDPVGKPLVWNCSVGQTIDPTHYAKFDAQTIWNNNCLQNALVEKLSAELTTIINNDMYSLHEINTQLLQLDNPNPELDSD